MQKGFNSDVNYKGCTYHVQTEDWGQQNPFIVSRIFRNGAVVMTLKKSYSEIPEIAAKQTEMVIKQALRRQHGDMVDRLISGRLQLGF